MSSIKSTTIVGAGIAGLTAALALARRGIAAHVIEQAPALEEVGAGLQLSPNASRILADLGLLEAIAARWTEPEHILLVSGRSLVPLARIPAGATARSRWGAPYGVLHRASLQAVLLDAVRAEALCTLTTGTRIEKAEDALSIAPAETLIAADGVWSRLRLTVPGAPSARYSGNVAWRFLVPFDAAPPCLDPRAVTAFLGPHAHLIAYPLAQAQAFNIVAIHAQPDAPPEGWLRRGDSTTRGRLLKAFAGWHEEIGNLLPDAQDPLVWPLFGCADGAWTDGRTVLIGDAAHAITPFAAQGAAMAIEDAALLAKMLGEATDSAQALRGFEKTRRARVARVRGRGAFNRFVYHARGPVALARDLALSLRKPESLIADLDWLYGYRIAD